MRLFLFFLLPCCIVAQTDTSSFLDRFWISGQANFIRQQHDSFYSPYAGTNSLPAPAEHATSRVLTLYTGFQITGNLEILADVESAGGFGLGNALGLAGFTNVDVVRNPTLGSAPYVSRVMLHYVLPLSKDKDDATPNPFSLAKKLAARRLEFRLGKMGTVDFFDLNGVGSDSHLQFLNWTSVNNGAYDYAADTRGYTYGFIAEYDAPIWAMRFGEMLMPTIANGIKLDWNIARARGENLELELHGAPVYKRPAVVRLLSFVNHANMGSYRDAIDRYVTGRTSVPDIIEDRKQGRIKYGFALNAEQQITSQWRAFGRLGWNDGRNESFAYTEVDRTVSFGSDLAGKFWHRPNDKVGAAFVANAISGDHRRYLALGGLGFILGDGRLNYGLEKIFETYYTAHIWRGISCAVDWQHVTDPGYNKDRGPVSVIGFRIHVEDTLSLSKIAGAIK